MEPLPLSQHGFSIGSRHYLLEDSKWINRYSNKKKSAFFPSKRYMHASVIHNNFLYLFGGSEKHKNVDTAKDSLYRLDLNSWEWERIGRQLQPLNRDSFGLAELPHCFIVFGGSDHENIFNDLWQFTYQTEAWTELPQTNRLPARDVCNLVALNSDLLLLYGGMNANTVTNYSDCHVYSIASRTWTELTITDPIESRQCATITNCGGKLYLFGGYGVTPSEHFYNDLYRIDINIKEKVAQFQLIDAHNKPPKRSAHGMIDLNENCLLVIGGEGLSEQGEEVEDDVSTKNDVWVFNLESKHWTQIFPKNANFRPRLGFSMSRQGNSVFLFGGLRNYSTLYDQLMILTFSEDKNKPKEEICSNCHKKLTDLTYEADRIRHERLKPKAKQIPLEPTAEMSNSFISAIACLQQFAFGAIGLITDCAVLVHADFVRIGLKKKSAELMYLQIQFSGNPLSNNEFVSMIAGHHNLPPSLRQFSDGLKMGGYRLGRTFVYVCRQGHLLKVVLYSINSCVVPGCESNYRYFAYIFDCESKEYLTQSGADHKRSIFNFLNTQVDDPNTLLENGPIHSVFVFEMKLITSSKSIFYELIPKSDKDIYVIINQKKIHFLEDLGYPVSEQPDVSLSNYLSLLYLQPTLKMYLNESTQPVKPFDYRQYLKLLAQKKTLQYHELEDTCINEIKSMDIYTILAEGPLPHNFGLLVYHSGRLLMRYKTQFAHLFSDRFFRNKYKKQLYPLFKEMGVLELNTEFVKPNLIKTDLQNNQYNCELWQKLRLFIKELPIRIIVDSEQQEESMKRRKVE